MPTKIIGRYLLEEVARSAKKLNPAVKVVMGEPYPTFFPEQVFELAPVDVVVLGEGEQTMVGLVAALGGGTT